MSKRRAWLVLCTIAAVTALMIWWWIALPDPLFRQPLSNVLIARDGSLLSARVAADGQWRLPQGATLPEKYRVALLAYEDKRFYEHSGVDGAAMLRAMYSNLRRERVVSGASTLSMQVIRLSRGSQARTYREKAIEALLALRLEARYSKAEILALYAGNAPFGGNVVGLDAAAWRYFGHAAHDLSWAEACTLAVLPNSPGLIHLNRNRESLQLKRDDLLIRLNSTQVIDGLELKLARREPLPSAPLAFPQNAPHLLHTLSAGNAQHEIHTTIDPQLQRSANALIAEHAKQLVLQDIDNVAMLVINNQSFEVLAYVGNSKWSVGSDRGYAVDIVQRPRSTGSILKPLLYAAMLESGDLAPRMLVPDVPTQYAGYMPENFDRKFRGAVPADVALAQSLNVPAVRLLKAYGVQRFYDFLRHAGITTLNRGADNYGLTLILGGAEGTLWDITNQYANLAHIARQDSNPKPHLMSISTLDIKESDTQRTAEIGAGSAWLTLTALLDVARPAEEAAWKNFASARRIAWKTGTSWGMRDAWAIGTTSHYTIGVWVGNATGEGRPGMTGAAVAAPIMFDMFNRLPTSDWFALPVRQLKLVSVCKNDGYLANGHCEVEKQWLPRSSHFNQQSANNLLLHVDSEARYQVHGDCESLDSMQHRSWFVLPPTQEFYYRQQHADYREVPPLRADCLQRESRQVAANAKVLDFVYPAASAKIYIPLELDAKRSNVVFEAVHRKSSALLYWHLDGQYLGSTKLFHNQALNVAAGKHVMTIVDDEGNRASRSFVVLDADEPHPEKMSQR